MGFNDKYNGAAGRDPDFGAIFMSNSKTKRECFKRKIFGLPSSEIKFVEKVKSGTILFLFEYEKRQLHGVFKASCDGGVNIVPKAFTSSGMQYPAQVKFIPLWFCKPLSENKFRDAIRENYFSARKFNFGLSEKQVCKLLHLFSMRKLELEVLGRHLTRTEDMKSEWYQEGKGGSSVGRGMLAESIQNDQVVGDNSSPVLMHKYKGGFSQYNGEVEYIGLNADDIVVSKQGRSADLEADTTNAYVSDYLHVKDESRFTACESEDYIDIHAPKLTVDTMSGYVSDHLALKDECGFPDHENKIFMDMRLRPYIVDKYSKIPSDNVRVYDDGRSLISDRLIGEDLRKTDQRMVFLDDIPGLHDSNVNPSAFNRKPILDRTSLVQNYIGPTSAVIHPFQEQILKTSCATQGDVSSLLCNPDTLDLYISQLSSVGINNDSEPIIEKTSPSTNCRRNSLSREPCLMDSELKDINRWHGIDVGFPNSVLYGRNRDCRPFNEAQNSDQLASESVLYESCNSVPSLTSSSAPVPSSDIGNNGGVHEPFSSLFYNSKSCLVNNVHHMASQKNLSHEITLQKNNETFSHDVLRANEGHSQVQYDNSLDHGYDVGCYGDSQNSNRGHPKKKSVFSRLSFVQDVKKQEKGNNAQKEKYDFHTSVDEVMEMARQSHNQWMTKRKPKASQPNKAESLRGKTQIISSRMKSDCVENTLEDLIMDLTAASGGNSNTPAEKICFVDFKHRSKVRKHSDNIERSSNESKKNEDSLLVKQKEKYDFHTSVDEVMEMARQSHNQWVTKRKPKPSQPNKADSLRGKTQIISSRVKSDCAENTLEDLIMDLTAASGGNSNTPAEEICFVDFKRRSKVRKHSDEIERSSNESKKIEDSLLVQQKRRKLIRPNFNKSTSSDGKGIDFDASQNLQVPLPLGSNNLKDVGESCCTLVQTKFDVKTDAEVQNIMGPTHSEGKNSSHAMGYIFREGGEKANDDTLPALNDGSERVENINHHSDLSSTSCKEEVCHTREGSCMTDNMKSVYPEIESLHSICQEHSADKIIRADRVINTDEEMAKDCGWLACDV